MPISTVDDSDARTQIARRLRQLADRIERDTSIGYARLDEEIIDPRKFTTDREIKLTLTESR